MNKNNHTSGSKKPGKTMPPFLKNGDRVAVVSPAFCIDEGILKDAVRFLEKWGLEVKVGKNAAKRNGPFAGSDGERLADLQEATDDPSIRAVFCARGGYGISRIIDRVDFTALETNPKWYTGFSDITVLHTWLSEVCGLVSVHGEMPLNFNDPGKKQASFRTLRNALFGKPAGTTWKGKFFRQRNVTGVVTGGNLSLFWSMTGSKADPDTKGKILFLEDVGEYYYHIDRLMNALRLAGKLDGLAALVIGGMNKMNEIKIPWGRTIEETINDAVKDYGYPVLFGFPAGHVPDNRAFYIGREASIEFSLNKAVLTYF